MNDDSKQSDSFHETLNTKIREYVEEVKEISMFKINFKTFSFSLKPLYLTLI